MLRLRTFALAAAALSCIGTAAAQVAPSPLSLPSPLPSPSATPFKLITLSGYGDGGFTAVAGTDQVRFVSGAPGRIFDGSTGPFSDPNGGRLLARPNDFNNALTLQNANLQLLLNGSVVSAKFEGSFGTDADVIASNGQPRSGTNLTRHICSLCEVRSR